MSCTTQLILPTTAESRQRRRGMAKRAVWGELHSCAKGQRSHQKKMPSLRWHFLPSNRLPKPQCQRHHHPPPRKTSTRFVRGILVEDSNYPVYHRDYQLVRYSRHKVPIDRQYMVSVWKKKNKKTKLDIRVKTTTQPTPCGLDVFVDILIFINVSSCLIVRRLPSP